MPTYDYQCRSCGVITEVVHSMFEDGPTTCPRCGGELRRVFHPTGIIFKGGGFYKTDSRSSSSGSNRGSSQSSPATSSTEKSTGDKGSAGDKGSGSTSASDAGKGSGSSSSSGGGD